MRKYWMVFLPLSPIIGLTSIAPVVLGALITAGAGLFQGLMQNKADQEENARKRLEEARLKAFETQDKAIGGLTEGQQRAFQSMMGAYQGAIR